MSETVLSHLDHLEKLMLSLYSKIDNVSGLVELPPEEMAELDQIEAGMKAGNYVALEETSSETALRRALLCYTV